MILYGPSLVPGSIRRYLQARQLWLFLAPSASSSAIVSGNGCVRCSGLLAMSTVVCPARLTAMTSAPRPIRYLIVWLSPRAAAW